MINKEFLKDLLSTYSPAGYEKEGVECFFNYMGGGECDAIGNGYVTYGNGSHVLLLSGHIDEIGMMVQNIDKNGFVYFIKNGGIDPKVLYGSNVTILSSNKVKGVIGKKPIHIESKCDKNNEVQLHEMKIDIGASSKEEAESLVSIGDRIVVDGTFIELSGSKFSSRGLDDKLGVYIVAEVIKQLKENEENGVYTLKNLKIYGSACVQEETGGSGAVNLSKINPEYSIDFDVHFATDDGYVDPNMCGDIKLGRGGAICHSVDCNYDFVSFIKDVCDINYIPYQEYSKGCGGTNTVKIKNGAFNCKTALLSIPLRNMHTQVEVADYTDIESLIDMTISVIYALDNKLDN